MLGDEALARVGVGDTTTDADGNSMKLTTRRPGFAMYALLPFVGLLALSIPILMDSQPWYDAPLLPFLRTAVERMSGWSLILLFVAAAVVGATVRGMSIVLASLAFIILLPVTMIAEMFVDPTSHNLWPFEFGIYLALALVPAVGLWLGRLAATPSQPSAPANSDTAR
jgi:hypothetical protein